MISLAILIAAYLLGSVPSAVVVTRIMGLPDPRGIGSGNPGATNVLRTGSKAAAALTLLGDVAKGIAAVVLARWLSDDPWLIAAAGLLAFLGHLYPVFLGFKGGKGVATAFGVCVTLSWMLGLMLAAVWLVTAVVSRYSSLAALVAAGAAPVCAWLATGVPPYVLLAVAIALLLTWRHRQNIGRLRAGTESQIRLKSG